METFLKNLDGLKYFFTSKHGSNKLDEILIELDAAQNAVADEAQLLLISALRMTMINRRLENYNYILRWM